MATISYHHVLASLQGAGMDPSEHRQLLSRAGINPDHLLANRSRIHTEQVGRLFRTIQLALDDEFMGFTQQRCRFGTFAMFSELIKHCKNLEEALLKGIEFYRLISDALEMGLNVANNQVELSFMLAQPALDEEHFLTEFLLVIWHRFPSWYIGETIRLKEIHFVHEAPQHLPELQIMFPGLLRFRQSSNRLIFDAEYLNRPLMRTQRELNVFLAHHPAEIMTIPGSDNSLEAAVENIILRNHPDKLIFPTATELAARLKLSPLTVYRHLKKEGTSYQQIKDNLRRERAIALLTRHQLSIEQIADITGFAEPRSFTRAFRQWTGLSPRDYRKLRRQI